MKTHRWLRGSSIWDWPSSSSGPSRRGRLYHLWSRRCSRRKKVFLSSATRKRRWCECTNPEGCPRAWICRFWPCIATSLCSNKRSEKKSSIIEFIREREICNCVKRREIFIEAFWVWRCDLEGQRRREIEKISFLKTMGCKFRAIWSQLPSYSNKE